MFGFDIGFKCFYTVTIEEFLYIGAEVFAGGVRLKIEFDVFYIEKVFSVGTVHRNSIRAQLVRLSMIIVTGSVLLSLLGTLALTLRNERRALDKTLLNGAQVLASATLVSDALAKRVAVEDLGAYLDKVTQTISDIDLIVVGDARRVLYYAPDSRMVGTVYPGTMPQRLLEGEAEAFTTDEVGPLGSEHAAYAAVHGEDGEVIGFVIVGVYTRSMAQVSLRTVAPFFAITLVALGLGALLAAGLSQRIKGVLMGYEPDAFARRLSQREEILEALEEGVLAVDRGQTVVFLNAAAAQLLGVEAKKALGQPLQAVCPGCGLTQVMGTGTAQYGMPLGGLGSVQVLCDCTPIYDGKAMTGGVAIFRNRTEIARLADDLTGVQHMVQAMRAYTHEFMNKLHVILGLLQIGQGDKAQDYIMEVTALQHEAVGRIMNQIKEPAVAALLVGKTSRANELGIRLRLDGGSALEEGGSWLPPEGYITILGNLIENAIESLNHPGRGKKEISVSVREEPDTLILCVEDTGPGIPDEVRRHMFIQGVSTKGKGRGTGLFLVQEVVQAYHGRLRVESELGIGTTMIVSFSKYEQSQEGEAAACIKS